MLCFNIWYGEGDLNEMDEETKNEIQTKKERYNQIQERYNEIKDTASPEELEALSDEGVDILNEIEELRGDKGDVYYIIPPNRTYGEYIILMLLV
jgi:hypothetical protein